MTTDQIVKDFRKRFQKEPEHIFFCPGRINLIGEHIDYNGGMVLPCAIAPGTYLAVARNIEKQLRFQSFNFPETASLHLQSSYSKTGKEWFNYPLGVINELVNAGHDLSGMDMFFYSNLPIGAGLSSSASIEVVTAFAVNEIFDTGLSLKDTALLCQQAENAFIGVNCGIMDQFAVALGKKDRAVLINCKTLVYEYIPFDTGEFSLVVINTNKQRTLSDSKYNERFAECRAALELLLQELPVDDLCDIDIATFDAHRHLLNDAILEKRALHVISENARVKDAVLALQAKDLETVGKLMYASHWSLKELYEVSGKELDTIVDLCREYKGCIGARMTGAGFGGCAIALVWKKSVSHFTEMMIQKYKEGIGYEPSVFATNIRGGAEEIKY